MGRTLLLVLAALGALQAQTAAGGGRVLQEWRFTKPADLLGWVPNSEIAETKVADGVLSGRCTGRDPYFWSPTFDLVARPWQVVEVELKCNVAGRGELFWSNSLTGPFLGFAQDKSTPFDIAASPAWQTIRLRPFWQAEKKIVHVRLDLCESQVFSIRAIRIVEPAGSGPALQSADFDFAAGAAGWSADGLEVAQATGAVRLSGAAPSAWWQSPALDVPVEDLAWAVVRLRAERPARVAVGWASTGVNGLRQAWVDVHGDGRFHTYNVAVAADKGWTGRILALAVHPAPAEVPVEVAGLRLTEEPQGPPDLMIGFVGREDAVARVGRPVRVLAQVANHGGEAAKGLTATLSLPAGVTLVSQAAPKTVEFQQPAAFRFDVQADRAVDGEMSFQLSGPGAPAAPVKARLVITPAPNVPRADYVPPPKPCPTKYRIGSYYFPGWSDATRWEPIQRVAPWRKPVLGWYNEGNPETVDWQIKWAVEHGISFFLVDWYWSAGNTHLMHWLDALAKARYRDQLQWAVMWANHNAPNTHSVEDWRKVNQYWLDHYFKLPSYLKIDGKPVVYIWAPSNIRRDLGGTAGAAKLLQMSQDMAKAAGLPGVVFVATSGGAGPGALTEAQQLASEGYVGRTSYHWWADAPQLSGDPRRFSYEKVVERSRQAWESFAGTLKQANLFFQPVADTGWSDEPWNNHLSCTGRTPELFEKLLREAKSYLDARGENLLVLGPWNEWGEGSYIEPNQEYGFEMLEAVRRVFGDGGPRPVELAPVDVGLGPYDLPPADAGTKTAWDFATATTPLGWGAMMGLADYGLRDGALYARTVSTDPALGSPRLAVRAKDWPYLLVTLKASAAGQPTDELQVFFATATRGISEESSVHQAIKCDGQWHTYAVNLAANSRWRGAVRQLRVDPGARNGRELWVKEIRFAATAETR